MALAEKILALRTARGLSQGDLAEALDVSRQSVSKWETGQSVPDLDKIVKLADLFQVTLDELARDGSPLQAAPPEPEAACTEPGRPSGMTPAQIAGLLVELLAIGMALVGMAVEHGFILFALIPALTGLPLLMVKRHPWLVSGWFLWCASFLIFNPWTTGGSLVSALNDLVRGRLEAADLIHLSRFALLFLLLPASVRALGQHET